MITRIFEWFLGLLFIAALIAIGFPWLFTSQW